MPQGAIHPNTRSPHHILCLAMPCGGWTRLPRPVRERAAMEVQACPSKNQRCYRHFPSLVASATYTSEKLDYPIPLVNTSQAKIVHQLCSTIGQVYSCASRLSFGSLDDKLEHRSGWTE